MLVASKSVLAPGDPLTAERIDYWAVEASGDDEIDRIRGGIYAAEALAYAQTIKRPEFVDIVILWMTPFPCRPSRSQDGGR
jgi:hypothetical protein